MTAAQRERAALVESLREHGPGAPTLCEEWTARDLAAHLVVRERRLDAAPGILVPQLAGYTELEKVEIARKFLAPKAIEGAGLTDANLTIDDAAFQTIIQRYTREAGVRNLEREIASISRKVARKVVVQGASFSEKIAAD